MNKNNRQIANEMLSRTNTKSELKKPADFAINLNEPKKKTLKKMRRKNLGSIVKNYGKQTFPGTFEIFLILAVKYQFSTMSQSIFSDSYFSCSKCV